MARNDLQDRFPNMTPVKSPPALFRMNGCGVSVYGKRDFDAETQTYITTWCLCLVFVPVLCLRAYRVARAPQGWYFIGREPLSTFAKAWNVVLLALIAAIIGGVQYTAYISSPAHRAQVQFTSAQKMVEQGHLAQSANIFQSLVTSSPEQTDNATAALRDLLDNRCPAAPLSESVGVYTAVTELARRSHTFAPEELTDKAFALTTAKGDAEPRFAVQVLDTVRPLNLDTRKIDTKRLGFLKKWAAAEPANIDAVVPLAALLEQQNDLKQAKSLLLPVRDKLTDTEGARVLGSILSREGDYDGAYALLWPYVKSRLETFHAAEKNTHDTFESIWHDEINNLKNDKGPEQFYDTYKQLSKEKQDAYLQDYIYGKIKANSRYTTAQQAMEHEAAVVPVALELGIVMLQRAQAQTAPETRKQQLEAAEQTFLAVSGFAGESDEYRLALGQVYYWLGKQAQGKKLFDDYLVSKQRAPKDLVAIAHQLRNLGAVPEARTLAEEAYDKSSGDQRYAAAEFRSICYTDIDDHIAWINKCNLAQPNIKAELAVVTGEKAFSEGRDTEAANHFREAIAAYAAMPRSPSSLNQSAIVYSQLFSATGDKQAYQRCLENFQQALDLAPADPILIDNAGNTLLAGALADIIGNQIDLRALHEDGTFELLRHLYSDQASKDAIVKKINEHPGVARARSYLEKVPVLSPKHSQSYLALAILYDFIHDDKALASLDARIKAADIDASDQITRLKESIARTKDAQQLPQVQASVKRAEERVQTLRPQGGRTAAVAIDNLVELQLALQYYNESTDLEKTAALAEEAYRISPSSQTLGILVSVKLTREVQKLRAQDAEFAAFYNQYTRACSPPYILLAAAEHSDALRQKIAANPEIKAAATLTDQDSQKYTTGYSLFDYALIKVALPAKAENIARSIRSSPRYSLQQSVFGGLNPYSTTHAIDGWWLAQIQAQPDAAKPAIQRVKSQGIPIPIQ